MQYKIFLRLIAIPTLASSMLTMALLSNMASAAEAMRVNTLESATSPTSCDLPTNSQLKSSSVHRLNRLNKGILVASSTKIPQEDLSLNFSELESDTAVALFGCDCSSCIRALRQLRAQPLIKNGQGHCWSSLQGRVSPQRMENLLQTLDAEVRN
ncbi:MAG TPA: hypothetical protein V6D15_10375 [Oculatellaceae cyanobacterium]|jgi:hypothetical protein